MADAIVSNERSPISDTAIHEAGHVVAHVRLDLGHDGGHIVPEENILGAALGEGFEHVWDKSGAEPVVLAFCAGYAAMIAAGYGEDRARAGTGSDFDGVQKLIDFWELPGTLEDWLAKSVALMRRPENVKAVALVAEHLMRHKRLTGDYCNVLVELADGEATEAEFSHYVLMSRPFP